LLEENVKIIDFFIKYIYNIILGKKKALIFKEKGLKYFSSLKINI